MNSHRRQARGFVLILALVLLVLAAVTLSAVARLSMAKALAAGQEVQDLQRRWGTLSCGALVLPQAEALLAQQENRQRRPVAWLSHSITLGDLQFELIVADEQAKLNAAALWARAGKQDAQRLIQPLLETELALKLSMPAAGTWASPGATIDSFQQVLPGIGPERLLAGPKAAEPSSPSAAAAALTCWGSGPLNYRRASAPVLAAACAPALSVAQADQLIRVRDQSWPPVALDDALRTLVLTDSQRRVVHARLAEQSDCHSLWILVQAPATRHPWCELVIAQSQAAGQQKLTRFCW